MRFPKEYWDWERAGAPNPKSKPLSWRVRHLLHIGKPKPVVQPSLFHHLGGFCASFSAFPPDTESAEAFLAAGGKWVAAQFGDTATEANTLRRFDEGLDDRWRQAGAKVLGWDRTNQIKDREGEYAVDMTDALGLDGWIFNPEDDGEIVRTHESLREYRLTYPKLPLAVITKGKVQGFPTGALAELDAYVILECFLETPDSDHTVTNSVRYWLASQVALARINCCLLHKPGYARYPTAVAASEARALGVHGLSSFTAENTPATEWKVMA